MKTCLFNACNTVCDWKRGGKPKRNETWWWNYEVNSTIKEKKQLWKEWQKGGDKERYLKGRQSPLKGKEHKKTNLVILKAMINVIKSLRKLVE